MQNILIDTEKQSSANLSIRSDESINEDSSFFKSPEEEAPKIAAELNAEANENLKEEKEKPVKEDSLVVAVNKDKEEKADAGKLQEKTKIMSFSVESNEEENDLKEKIRINSIEILINIVTLTPSMNNFFVFIIYFDSFYFYNF